MAAGEVDSAATQRGIKFIADTQAEHGLWDEEEYTAVGFPRVFYLRYHGYRAFFPNGFNVTRSFVLFIFEIGLEVTSSLRAARRDIRPRGHRGGTYPLLRGAMCVIIRDLIVYGVLTDMMAGRPAVYATFSSYDEVAHHSGLMRADTLEALRKLDKQFGRIARARRYAPRPY